MTKLERLAERVEHLEATKKPDNAAKIEEIHRFTMGLAEDERSALAYAIVDAEKDGTSPGDQAWLSKRPQDQQAVVRKVMALDSKLRELEQEMS